MHPAGSGDPGPVPVSWDEAREVIALVLSFCAASMALAPIAFRLIDGQWDRNGFRSALQGATTPATGLVVLAAAVVVATTPAADVTPRLRRIVNLVAVIVVVLCVIHILDLLFAESAGGVRRFFTRFPTILWRPGPAALMAGVASWTARRVVPFPGG
jgi:hypothetical protein